MNLKYFGEFGSSAGVPYRIEIGTTEEVASAAEVFFPGEEPLVIEWEETDKITPICPSSATLQVLSVSDRQFIDMYSVSAGAFVLTVYRNGSLYWRGTLDTEVYEEPYSYRSGYVVTLTFTDFGILDRLAYSCTGCVTIQSVIEWCLKESRILTEGEMDDRIVRHVSTASPKCGYTSASVDSIFGLLVNTDNFVDDGEDMTAEDVLTAVLQPLALQIRQKAGHVYVFDINALSKLDAVAVEWMSDDAVLSADRVYNNVSVNYSPADDAEVAEGTVEEDKDLPADSGGALIYCNYHRDSFGRYDSGEGFRLHTGGSFESNIELANGAVFYQIVPVFSGNEETGVFWGRRAGHCGMSDSQGAVSVVGKAPCGVFLDNDENGTCISAMIMKLPAGLINYTSIDRSRYSLKVGLSLLFDVRYNPFENQDESNEGGNYSRLQDWVNFAYVPVRLILRDKDGAALYHYENRRMLLSDSYTNRSSYCKWVAGEGQWGDAFLAYYDSEDRKSASGCGGWKENRPIIGYYRGGLPSVWDKRGDGDFIDLPPVGGFLEMQVGSGVHQFDYKRKVKDIYSRIRWVMYKDPYITLCYKNGVEVEGKDIEEVAYLNRAAKEDLSIDTMIGTPPGKFGLPAAKGLFLAPDYSAVTEFTREGVSDRIERLLIGTVYSQYASRKTVLSGTVRLLSGFGVCSDVSLAGKKLVPFGETQDLQADLSEVTMVEIAGDSYEGVEFE